MEIKNLADADPDRMGAGLAARPVLTPLPVRLSSKGRAGLSDPIVVIPISPIHREPAAQLLAAHVPSTRPDNRQCPPVAVAADALHADLAATNQSPETIATGNRIARRAMPVRLASLHFRRVDCQQAQAFLAASEAVTIRRDAAHDEGNGGDHFLARPLSKRRRTASGREGLGSGCPSIQASSAVS